MWARVIEFMLACWLAVSPLVFSHAPGRTLVWVADYSCAVLVASAALLSFHSRLRRCHLLHLPVAGAMILLGLLMPDTISDPAAQNYLVVALLLGMFAIVPSRAAQPPRAWREFLDARLRESETSSSTPTSE